MEREGGICGSGETACGGKSEGVLCDEQGDAAFVELFGEQPAGTTNAPVPR